MLLYILLFVVGWFVSGAIAALLGYIDMEIKSEDCTADEANTISLLFWCGYLSLIVFGTVFTFQRSGWFVVDVIGRIFKRK